MLLRFIDSTALLREWTERKFIEHIYYLLVARLNYKTSTEYCRENIMFDYSYNAVLNNGWYKMTVTAHP